MKVGIVCWWFNRGQATVGRQLRDLLDQLGHRTYILARPSSPREHRPGFISSSDVWQQPGVTFASGFEVPINEYLRWVDSNELSTVFFDENFQFETIEQIRRSGIKTIGRFVWEHFSTNHVPAALKAYDVIYSLTSAEQQRYQTMGIEVFLPRRLSEPAEIHRSRGAGIFQNNGQTLALDHQITTTDVAFRFAALGSSTSRACANSRARPAGSRQTARCKDSMYS